MDWNTPIDLNRISHAWRQGRALGLVREDATAVLFHDLLRMGARVAELQAVFPPRTVHALAIKANPLVQVLRCAVGAGAGLEAASLEEVWLAQAAGCPPSRIIFDSPAKSTQEIHRAIELGVWINADNTDELARIEQALTLRRGYRGRIGLRVNPLVGEGKIAMTSVGGHQSKFGVPVSDAAALLDLYRRYHWLTGIHVHVGSQGAPLQQLVAAARVAFDLRASIENVTGRAIEFIDLGGGLPARYDIDADPPTPRDYVAALRAAVPELFDFQGVLVTEFGRAVQASCGWAVSRVEYVKTVANQCCAVLHLGADFLMRPVYRPAEWRHRFYVLDQAGRPKAGDARPVQLLGPLCFAGDIVAPSVLLPPIETDDLVVIGDTGAYTLSLWSRHCNRAIPMVIGVRDTAAERLEPLKARETAAEIVALWS